jgi:alpha-mannosidase
MREQSPSSGQKIKQVEEEALIAALEALSKVYELVKDRQQSSRAWSIKKLVQQAQRDINMKIKEREAPIVEFAKVSTQNEIMRSALETVLAVSERHVVFRDCMCWEMNSGIIEALEAVRAALGYEP